MFQTLKSNSPFSAPRGNAARASCGDGAKSDFLSTSIPINQKPSLETLSIFAHHITTINAARLATVAKIQSLQIAFSVDTYEGGLKQLRALPHLKSLSLYQVDLAPGDLEKFKEAFPSVKVNYTPMGADYRAKWDAIIAKEAIPAKQ